jgi:hypothetical protein
MTNAQIGVDMATRDRLAVKRGGGALCSRRPLDRQGFPGEAIMAGVKVLNNYSSDEYRILSDEDIVERIVAAVLFRLSHPNP